jgi:hypothetical protein
VFFQAIRSFCEGGKLARLNQPLASALSVICSYRTSGILVTFSIKGDLNRGVVNTSEIFGSPATLDNSVPDSQLPDLSRLQHFFEFHNPSLYASKIKTPRITPLAQIFYIIRPSLSGKVH